MMNERMRMKIQRYCHLALDSMLSYATKSNKMTFIETAMIEMNKLKNSKERLESQNLALEEEIVTIAREEKAEEEGVHVEAPEVEEAVTRRLSAVEQRLVLQENSSEIRTVSSCPVNTRSNAPCTN
ncbi:hypothetical protein Ancab_030297 [Ancistrocladus abbreviatus]